ncbi:MAG: hypothetical protein ABEJ28_05340 [Salinigranum sp.]
MDATATRRLRRLVGDLLESGRIDHETADRVCEHLDGGDVEAALILLSEFDDFP